MGSVIAVLVLMACLAGVMRLAPNAQAFTYPDTLRDSRAWFGYRCADVDRQSIFLPKGTYRARVVRPRVGSKINFFDDPVQAATVTDTVFKRQGTKVVITVAWDGGLCSQPNGFANSRGEDGLYQTEWTPVTVSYRRRLSGRRFKGYAEGVAGPEHQFVVGDGFTLVLRDRAHRRTRYRACWSGAGGHYCWRARRTNHSGTGRIFTAAPSRVGNFSIRWYVRHRVVARWSFYNGLGD